MISETKKNCYKLFNDSIRKYMTLKNYVNISKVLDINIDTLTIFDITDCVLVDIYYFIKMIGISYIDTYELIKVINKVLEILDSYNYLFYSSNIENIYISRCLSKILKKLSKYTNNYDYASLSVALDEDILDKISTDYNNKDVIMKFKLKCYIMLFGKLVKYADTMCIYDEITLPIDTDEYKHIIDDVIITTDKEHESNIALENDIKNIKSTSIDSSKIKHISFNTYYNVHYNLCTLIKTCVKQLRIVNEIMSKRIYKSVCFYVIINNINKVITFSEHLVKQCILYVYNLNDKHIRAMYYLYNDLYSDHFNKLFTSILLNNSIIALYDYKDCPALVDEIIIINVVNIIKYLTKNDTEELIYYIRSLPKQITNGFHHLITTYYKDFNISLFIKYNNKYLYNLFINGNNTNE